METIISDPFYSFLFIGLGMIFLFLEVFVPSGGILGLLSLACAAFGIYGLFHQEKTGLALGAIVGVLTVSAAGVRFGLRRLSFSASMSPADSSSVDERLESLGGKEGITHTPLRPAGVAIIDGRKVDVVAQGGFVEQNVTVRVIDTTGNRVVVRPVRSSTEDMGQTSPTATGPIIG